MLLIFRYLWKDGTSASMYREIMLRNKSNFQISTLVCLSSIYICNLLIDLPAYINCRPIKSDGRNLHSKTIKIKTSW
jgi:hypothetical protein